MNQNMDGDGIDDVMMGIPQGVSTGDLIQTSKSREDGYRMGEPEVILIRAQRRVRRPQRRCVR